MSQEVMLRRFFFVQSRFVCWTSFMIFMQIWANWLLVAVRCYNHLVMLLLLFVHLIYLLIKNKLIIHDRFFQRMITGGMSFLTQTEDVRSEFKHK